MGLKTTLDRYLQDRYLHPCVNSGLINNDPIQRGFCAGMGPKTKLDRYLPRMGLKTTLDRYLRSLSPALDRYLQYLQHRSARVQARGSTDLGRLAETSGTPSQRGGVGSCKR
jgi:hypothetical protein